MFTLCVTRSPIVSRSAALRVYEEVLRVVDVSVWTGLNGVDHLSQVRREFSRGKNRTNSRFEVEQNSSGNISRIVTLYQASLISITGDQ